MIIANYADRQTLQFRVLSDGQCRELYAAALECLQRVGVQVNHPEAQALLAAAGADVTGNVARIPAHIIQDALAATPPSFNLWSRDGKRVMPVAVDRVNFGPGLTNTYFLDPYTGKRRKSRRGDPAMTARVCDALEQIDYVIGLALIDDVTASLAPVYEFAELVANTTKPILAWAYSAANVAAIYEIGVAVAGGAEALRRRPFFALFSTYQSPLVNTREDLGNVIWAADHDIPIVYHGGPIVGMTSPVTGASTLVLTLATALSGLAITQLRKRGAPFVLGGAPAPADLRTSRMAYGAPEMSLYTAAFADLCRYLGVPSMGTAGASESKTVDSQAAIEASVQILASGLSGASLVHDLGFLDCAEIGSLSFLVMTDEIVALVKRLLRGVEVNAETIMMDLLEEVGPGGHFLAEKRSARLCRQEVWVPRLMDRDNSVIWEQHGGKGMEARAAERVRAILETHQPEPLAGETQARIEQMLAEAEVRAQGRPQA